ncbi:MAG: S8 family peptidase [Ignavibacteria bacterium]|nr:S8 family peptidase [Ignavibacteria bacterium]
MKKLALIPFLFLVLITFQGNYSTTKLSRSMETVVGRMSDTDSVLCWVFFKDKGPSTEKYLKNPSLVVTQKSIERRRKFRSEQNLIDETDLPIYAGYIEEFQKMGLQVKGKSKWLNSVSMYVAKSEVLKIEKLPFVSHLDLVVRFSKKYSSDLVEAPSTDQTKMILDNKDKFDLDYGQSLTQNQMMSVPAMHNLGITGAGVTVCVLDAGFNNLQHESFSQITILDKWDFVNNDGGVGDSLDMGSGSHGTNVLSAIGGYKPGKLIGPAYGASYLLAKTENTDSETPIEEDNWIAGIEWADSLGADLATSSLGYLEYDPPFQSYTWQDMDGNTARITRAADLAVSKGIAVFVSAGNEGMDATHNTLGAPADGDSVISVGAVDASRARAYFSSVGLTVDGRIKPDIMAMGQGVRVASSYTLNGYSQSSGTSFSCPLAAGVGALILSQRPNISPVELANSLRSTADNASNPNREYGWGIINGLAALNSIPAMNIEDAAQTPSDIRVYGNYPNPFNPSTKIDFELSSISELTIDLYNATGEKVKRLGRGFFEPGRHTIDVEAGGLNSGVYFVKLKSSKSSKVVKIVLSK